MDELKPVVLSVKKGSDVDFSNECESIIRKFLKEGYELKYFQSFPPNLGAYGNWWYGIIVMLPKVNAKTD